MISEEEENVPSPPPQANQPNQPSSSGVVKQGCLWKVAEGETFTNQLMVDFSSLTSLPSSLKEATNGVNAEPDAPETVPQIYQKENVVVKDGTMQLKVPGGQSQAPIRGAEVVTMEENIFYASVRTWMQIDPEPGVCSGKYYACSFLPGIILIIMISKLFL